MEAVLLRAIRRFQTYVWNADATVEVADQSPLARAHESRIEQA